MERNRLGEETSPYLLQHRDNPVHWQPWDPAVLKRPSGRQADPAVGRLRGLPLVPCDGAENFEDPEIAATMNRLFVNMKS